MEEEEEEASQRRRRSVQEKKLREKNRTEIKKNIFVFSILN